MRRVQIRSWEMHKIIDDHDEVVGWRNNYEAAYAEAHRLANANERIYRVKTEQTTVKTKTRALAVPIGKSKP